MERLIVIEFCYVTKGFDTRYELTFLGGGEVDIKLNGNI